MKEVFDDAFIKSLDAAKESGSYTVNSINPFRIEGNIWTNLEKLIRK